jgi:RND family efflux transporter MFP subunit
MSGRLGWLLVVVAVAVGGWLVLRPRGGAGETTQALASESTRPSGGPLPVRTVAPAPARFRPTVTLEGTLQPIREADLGFKVPGRLESVKVRLGAHVAAGETLARLEHGEAKAQLLAAHAQTQAAAAQLDLADDTSRRATALADRGVTPAAAQKQAVQQRAVAEAQVSAAEAQAALAEESLRNHVLVAPFAGVVTRAPSGTGAIINPNMPLFHIADLSALRLSASVSEGEAQLVRQGAPLTLNADGVKLTGRVTAVVGAVDAATRRMPVEAELPNDGNVLAGVLARAQVVAPEELELLRLPATALRPGSQDEILVVAGGRLERRAVRFFLDGDGALMVRSGLKAGERVVVSPTAEMRDGDLVRIAD